MGGRHMTYEELLAHEEASGARPELIDGRIVYKASPRGPHSRAQARIAGRLLGFDRDDEDGWWIFTEQDVLLRPDLMVRPDVAGWRRSRLPVVPDGAIQVPPDWVCEILSRSNEHHDRKTKRDICADAHAVYDHLYEDGSVTEVNCWAHCRRYFFKAFTSDPDRAEIALGLIGALFKIERSIKTAPRRKREKIRRKHSRPIVDRFFSWCDSVWPELFEDTPIYDGVRYARNQKTGLMRFLDDGRLPLDNNISERNLRGQAVGRKNWLFVGSDDGGRANAAFTSLLASCRMLGVEPWSYLRDILCLLPSSDSHRILELAPVNWMRTPEQPDVRDRLDANPYRALTLIETLG